MNSLISSFLTQLPVEIVTIITAKLDNGTLERLSHTRAWSHVASALRSYNFWFLRVTNFVGKSLAYRQADWKATFYDLAIIHPWKRESCFLELLRLKRDSTLTLETLLELPYFPPDRSLVIILVSAVMHKERGFLITLLEDKRVKSNQEAISEVLFSCLGMGTDYDQEGSIIASYLTQEQLVEMGNSFL